MEFTFLGTSAGMPTRERNVSALAVRQRGWSLFDCGEGTQHQLLRTTLSLHQLRRIFVSHLHGDHCFGLFGLLGSRAMQKCDSPLTIYGPRGVNELIRTVLRLSDSRLSYRLSIEEVPSAGGTVVEDEEGWIKAVPLDHRIECFGWWIGTPARPGRLDPEITSRLGVPKGPLWGALQRGESVTLEHGRVVHSHEVLGPERPGQRLLIAGDNRDADSLLGRTGALDVLIHEATFTEAQVESMGDDRGHSTAHRVARAAQRQGVASLVLTHFSARYGMDLAPLQAEARAEFSGRLLFARDFDRYALHPSGHRLEPLEPVGDRAGR